MDVIATAWHGQVVIFLADSSYLSEAPALSVCVAIHGNDDCTGKHMRLCKMCLCKGVHESAVHHYSAAMQNPCHRRDITCFLMDASTSETVGFGVWVAGGKPHRDPANRWHVPVEEWPWETYPAWAHGAGYVITKDLVHEIAAGAAMKIQNHTLFRLEDISMGAWVEYVSKEKGWYVQLVKDKRFNFNGCLGTDLVSHYIQAQQMRCMYENNGKCCIGGKLAQSKGLTRKGIT